ncbi:MAG: capsule assembly Wzi family protein [Paludibacter sp.]|nr:capsule assembly Wzi family protein [Paludibacter sp.]
MKKLFLLFLISLLVSNFFAQDIPQHISYTRIYDFLDELAADGLIELNSAIKPYSRSFITHKLIECQQQNDKLSKRQQEEITFFLNDYAPETDKLPETRWNIWQNEHSKAALIQPAFHYRDSLFRARITPILGMQVVYNSKGNILQRWYGAEFQAMIGKHLSVFGSLRDLSNVGDSLSYQTYLNLAPGYQYKEASYGFDYSDSRGGIKYANDWGSIGLVKDNIVWGDNSHGANILSGRAPSFPMITLRLKPAKWFELNYFHAWLVSNVVDSTYYYVEDGTDKEYRPANKYMAANMFTFTPIQNLNLSVGNSIIYAERTIQVAYLIPIAFYKSLDHTLTKGLRTENQNSQLFMNFSSRNLKHTHFFTSVFIDEFSFSRLSPDNDEANPISYKLGAQVYDFPVSGLSFFAEFTRTNILNYKHSMPVLTYQSNGYNLGHYLGDNAQEIYFALQYKPLRGANLKLSYTNARHGNEYEYLRSGTSNGLTGSVRDIISQPSLGEIIWSDNTLGFEGIYEIINNAYAVFKCEYSDIQAFEPTKAAAFGEKRMTAQETLDYYTPDFLQGRNLTFTAGFSFGF